MELNIVPGVLLEPYMTKETRLLQKHLLYRKGKGKVGLGPLKM